MELLSTVVFGVLAFYLGWILRGAVMLRNLSENPERVIKILEQIKKINQAEAEGKEFLSGETELSIERVGNVLYAYAKESGEFIAQGPDLNSLLASANARYPNSKFFGYISKDDSAKELV